MGDEYLQWNIRGIKDVLRRNDKIDKVINLLEIPSKIRVLNLQETHLMSPEDTPSQFKNFEHLFHIINNFATPDDRAAGICMFVNKTESILIQEHLLGGRLTYIQLCSTVDNKIKNIFSYYGKSRNGREDWKSNFEIIQNKVAENNLENIIILGDFNFATSILDRNTQNLNSIDNLATPFFIELQEKIGIIDSFRITNPKRRLYTYYHTDRKSKSRIDRIYIDTEMSLRVEATHFEFTNLSDHKVVRLRVGNNVERGPGSWIFNNSLLYDEDFSNKMIEEIRYSGSIKHIYASKRAFWDYLKMNMQSVAIQYAAEKSKEKKTKLFRITRELEELDMTPSNLLTEYAQTKAEDLKKKLSVLEKEKIEGMKLRSKIPNHDYGEPNISFLSKLEKLQGERNTIYSLKNENGELKANRENLLEIVNLFYKKLYTKEDECEQEQNNFLRRVQTQISDTDKTEVDRVLEEAELFESLKGLQKNKSPGCDGLTVEFMLHYWGELKEHYMDAIAEIIQTQELCELQKRGAIRISFKKGDRDDLKNYRPITLLNVDLKIITHALSKRLANVLPKLVHNYQKAVPGRIITENIHIVQDLINLINKNGDSAAFLFYDQEKAFDRMSHTFIIKTLKKYGFGDNFISWVKILLNDIKSFVKVNGFETGEFGVYRGVRQGCALSALLYVLVSEVLALEIRKNSRIRGYMHNGNHFKLTQYADDLSTVVTDISSVYEIFEVLRRFERATNAKINKTKTEALWVGGWRTRTDTPLGLKWKKDYVKFLGVYVGNMTNHTERLALSNLNFQDISDKITKKLCFWNGSGISIKGKIRVVNTFVLSKIFYRLECVDITKEMQESIEKQIRMFLWGERRIGRIEYSVLSLNDKAGGLKLLDIGAKVRTMRIKWLLSLSKKDNNQVERYIVDKLIGCYRGIDGLKLLNHTIDIRNFRNMNVFYANAIKHWRASDITFEAVNIRSIRNEIIYYNNLLRDRSNNTFKFFNLNNNQNILPTHFKDLPVSRRLTQLSITNRGVIGNINQAYWNTCTSRLAKVEIDCYTIKIGALDENIDELSSKQIYWSILNMKQIEKRWETKWNSILRYYTLDIEISEWERIWGNIHDKIVPYEIQSAIWEMLHLNFYCGYKERMLNYGTGICKLCGELEEGPQHIVITCKVLWGCVNSFINMLRQFKNINVSNDELAFGLAGADVHELNKKDRIRNLVTFIIRKTVFRNRHKEYGNVQNSVNVLKSKICYKINQTLKDMYIIYKYKFSVNEFVGNFLIDSILGNIENGILHIHI